MRGVIAWGVFLFLLLFLFLPLFFCCCCSFFLPRLFFPFFSLLVLILVIFVLVLMLVSFRKFIKQDTFICSLNQLAFVYDDVVFCCDFVYNQIPFHVFYEKQKLFLQQFVGNQKARMVEFKPFAEKIFGKGDSRMFQVVIFNALIKATFALLLIVEDQHFFHLSQEFFFGFQFRIFKNRGKKFFIQFGGLAFPNFPNGQREFAFCLLGFFFRES